MGRVKVRSDEGKVTTPFNIALRMVDKLFKGRPPRDTSRVLDAGCGSGVFIDAVLLWCKQRGIEPPEIVGVEIDPQLVVRARKKFGGYRNVRIIRGDFLTMSARELEGGFDYVISNPPYISYEKIDPPRRRLYRELFEVAVGRFDTYMLFFEKALEVLKPGGRLVFITPEKYLYVLSARNLRRLLAQYYVEEIELVREDAFKGVLAYPTITVICKSPPSKTSIVFRDGRTAEIDLPRDGSPWLAKAQIQGYSTLSGIQSFRYRLKDIVVRVSAGVATGRDDIFVIPKAKLPEELRSYAYPTVSGSELVTFKPGEAIDYNRLRYVILVPYSREGRLLSEGEAKPLIRYLSRWRPELEARYVVKTGKKKWYAFHEDPPLKDIMKPKILCRDITREPTFYVDPKGLVIPRHSVYYLVPKNPYVIPELVEHLNSDEAREWLKTHSQRAANGYIRLQSHVLKELPIPDDLFLKSAPQSERGLDRWIKP